MVRKIIRNSIFVIAALLILLFAVNMSSREGFVSVNPLPTSDDFKSANTGSPTPTLQKIISYIKSITWSTPVTDNEINNLMFVLGLNLSDPGLDKTTNLINSYSTKPTFQQVLTDWNNLRTQKLPDSQIQSIIQTGPTENPPNITGNGMVYQIYTYVFGSSTQQPLTMYIPQPCSASFKSIPGGAVDIHCFN